ncbi:MAG: non-canonical purine NTP pyrophosphatase [Bacilli bacterium]
MIELTYVTGNKVKLELAQKLFGPYGIKVIGKKIDCPEIQADTNEEIAKYSSKYASNILKTAVLKNDTGLIIPVLNGFPGPYTRYIEEKITEDGILKLMQGKENREAYFIECLAYTEYGKEPIVFISKTKGKIALESSGKNGWGYDYIFIPEGYNLPLANFDEETQDNMWSSEGYQQLAEYLINKE